MADETPLFLRSSDLLMFEISLVLWVRKRCIIFSLKLLGIDVDILRALLQQLNPNPPHPSSKLGTDVTLHFLHEI